MAIGWFDFAWENRVGVHAVKGGLRVHFGHIQAPRRGSCGGWLDQPAEIFFPFPRLLTTSWIEYLDTLFKCFMHRWLKVAKKKGEYKRARYVFRCVSYPCIIWRTIQCCWWIRSTSCREFQLRGRPTQNENHVYLRRRSGIDRIRLGYHGTFDRLRTDARVCWCWTSCYVWMMPFLVFPYYY